MGRDIIYAYFTTAGRTARLRLSADECDQLDLFEGAQVSVGIEEREPAIALVTAMTPAPPFVWVEVEFAGMASRAG